VIRLVAVITSIATGVELAAQAPIVVGGTGGALSAPAASAARLGIVTSQVLGVVDVLSGQSGRATLASAVTVQVPLGTSARALLNGQLSHAAGGAARLEVGSTAGAWVGMRFGPARADSLGFDAWNPALPALVVPVGGPSVSGPIGYGAGLWGEQWGVVFGASVMTGSAGYRTTHIAQHWQSDTIPEAGDSVFTQLITDTTNVNRNGASWLARLSAHWALSRLSLDVSGGIVSAPNAPRLGWAGTTASWRLFSPVALVMSAGTRGGTLDSQNSPVRERPYLTGGVSLGWPTSAPARDRGQRADVRYWLTGRADSGYRLIIRVPWAHRVEVTGDVTDWVPVDCDQGRDGNWHLPRVVLPGVHRIMMRIDGGAWTAPPGAPRAVSEFGDIVGVIVTPQAVSGTR
jgi:hypothetical protein